MTALAAAISLCLPAFGAPAQDAETAAPAAATRADAGKAEQNEKLPQVECWTCSSACRASPSFPEWPPAGFSMDSLAPDSIERIEVLRAASAEFSTQSVAGTNNIVLKRSVKNRLREPEIAAQGSSNGHGRNANLQMSGRDDAFSYSASANAMQDRFEFDATGVEQGVAPGGQATMLRTILLPQKGEFRLVNLSPRWNWTLGQDNTLTSQTFVNAHRFKNRVGTPTTTLVGPPPYANLFNGFKARNDMLRSDPSWRRAGPEGGRLGLRQRKHLARRAAATAGVPLPDTTSELEGRDRGLNFTGKYSRKIEQGHTFAFGWDGGIDTRDDERNDVNRVRVSGKVPLYDGSEARVKRPALFAQDEWNITPAWSIYLGARWEGIRTRVTGNSFERAKAGSRVWNPIMQTLHKFPGKGGKNGGDQLRLALTRTCKAPGVGSLTLRRRVSENNSSAEPD